MEGPNLVALTGLVATSAALLNPIPLLAGLVAEAAYLLFIPDTKWYEKRLKKKFDDEVYARRELLKQQTFPIVRPGIRREFLRLEQVRSQIENQVHIEDPWFREAMRKLDFLMEKYLQFAQKEAQFANYLVGVYREVCDKLPDHELREMGQIVPPKPPPRKGRRVSDDEEDDEGLPSTINVSDEWVQEVASAIAKVYDRELKSLDESLDGEVVVANQNLIEKRKQVIVRRQEFITRVSQIMSNLGLQMSLMSDTFGLINDEIRARSPEQVLSDIDEVVLQATSLTEALDEMTPMAELVNTAG